MTKKKMTEEPLDAQLNVGTNNQDDDGLEAATIQFSSDVHPALCLKLVKLMLQEKDGKKRELTLDLPHIRIGSAPSNDVVISDPAISRYHCELRHSEKQGFVLKDLGSTNGTMVGNLLIREAMIHDEVTLQLGHSTLRILPGSEETRVDPSLDVKFGQLVGRSQMMREVFGILAKVATTDLTITIQGETGTGKDLVAQAIHQSSPRAKGPYIVFDAGAVAPNLIESELFGHEKGAFTGATEQRRGAFELADGGTLFIDEIGELALELQPKLLRALEQREVQRVGGAKRIPVDVRVICATNRSLPEEVKKGRFRDDLFFRISVVVLPLPSLRDRPEDIEILVQTFLQRGSPKIKAAADALSVLQNYDWPGNVRELKNVIETARAMCPAGTDNLHAKDLLLTHLRASGEEAESVPKDAAGMSLAGKTLDSIEKAAIAQTLSHFGGNRSAAARALGIAPSTLYLKLKKYELG
jgi:DNA-binding NtrC family response regulator